MILFDFFFFWSSFLWILLHKQNCSNCSINFFDIRWKLTLFEISNCSINMETLPAMLWCDTGRRWGHGFRRRTGWESGNIRNTGSRWGCRMGLCTRVRPSSCACPGSLACKSGSIKCNYLFCVSPKSAVVL